MLGFSSPRGALARILVLLGCGLFAGTLIAPPAVAGPAEEIAKSRQRGIEFLKSKQTKDGHWDFKDHEVGITALCTIALMENGVPMTDPVVLRGYEYVRDNCLTLKGTYDLSLSVVLLSRVGDRRDRAKIKALAARLVAGQMQFGGWSYTCPLVDPEVLTDRSKLPKPKEGFGDNSCTQFAVLGLWVASRTGIDIDRTLAVVAKRFERTQLQDGGWHYNLYPEEAFETVSEAAAAKKEEKEAKKPAPPPVAAAAPKVPPGLAAVPPGLAGAGGAAAAAAGSDPAKMVSGGAMTGAGLFCLAVAQAAQLREYKKSQDKGTAKPSEDAPPTESLLANPVFAKGLKRTGDFVKGIGGGGGRYFMWSVERIGVLLGLDKFGDTDWYGAGSAGLLKQQKEDGSWSSAHAEADPDGLSDTAFALLFLRKANLGSDISRLLEGEKDKKFLVVGRTPEARFETLDEAIAAAKAGETVRIDSNGPFKVGHLELTKDITLQAGFGYQTELAFEIGKNRLGIKLKPESDPNARDMITVKGAKVTLEGLRLKMDPPVLKGSIPWRAVAFQGGQLRVLNCMISEANKQGMAGVAMEAEGEVVLRNTVIVGGRAGVEVTGAGKQSLRIDNSVLFSSAGVVFLNDAKTKKPLDATVTLVHSVVQAKEAFRASKTTGKVAIDGSLGVIQAESVGLSFLAGTGAKDRTWTGDRNIYDVKQWVGSDGKTAAVKDLAGWTKLWGGTTDKASVARIAPFIGVRQVGNFSHEAFAQDWTLELPGDTNIELQKLMVGVNSFVAGPGVAYDQYRETISYSAWRNGKLEAEDISKTVASADK